MKSGSSLTAGTDCIPNVQLIPLTPGKNHQLTGGTLDRTKTRRFTFKDTDVGLTGFQVRSFPSEANSLSDSRMFVLWWSTVAAYAYVAVLLPAMRGNGSV